MEKVLRICGTIIMIIGLFGVVQAATWDASDDPGSSFTPGDWEECLIDGQGGQS